MRAAYGEEIPYKEVEVSTTSEQRRGYWEAAASLQEADGLRPSDEAYSRAERYVEGEISSSELSVELTALHRGENDSRKREADIVSARIVELLESSPFTLSPRTLVSIHGSLFEGVFRRDWVGRFRTVNLTKEEPVLGGRTVQYSNHSALSATLNYDFGMEMDRDHGWVEDSAELRKISRFVANV